MTSRVCFGKELQLFTQQLFDLLGQINTKTNKHQIMWDTTKIVDVQNDQTFHEELLYNSCTGYFTNFTFSATNLVNFSVTGRKWTIRGESSLLYKDMNLSQQVVSPHKYSGFQHKRINNEKLTLYQHLTKPKPHVLDALLAEKPSLLLK